VLSRLRHLTPLVGVALFGAALWLLHHALRGVNYHDVVRALRALPHRQVALAVLTTAAGYLCLTLYDTLACRYAGYSLPYRRTAFASFVGYAFSHTLGVPVLSGGAVRYRLYSAWGLSAADLAIVIAFNGFTFWLGFAGLGGLLFLVHPPAIPAALALPVHSIRGIGAALVALVAAYLVFTALRRTPIVVRGTEVAVPAPRMALAQLAVSTLDWTFAGATLWALLPATPHLSLPTLLGVFLLAQTAGLASHVPGGLGIFETAILLLLAPPLAPRDVLGSLLAFRAVYYFAPLALAALALGAHELGLRHTTFRRVAHLLEDWGSAVVPQVLAIAAFLSGTILLFSGATPGIPSRLASLGDVLPLGVLEASHFLGSLAGVGLIVLARDLQRRLDAAYLASVALLVAGIALSFLKGADYEEALILTITLAALLPCRRQFYRHTALLAERLTPAWTAAVVLVVGASVWLYLFAHRHTPYAHELWWRFELGATAPRALRATTGAVIAALFAGVWMLRRPTAADPDLPSVADLDRAQAIAAASPSAMSRLALLGDKHLLFSDSGRSFVMYGVEGRSWVALGDPVGPDDEATELAWRFRELSDRHDGSTVFYQVEAARLPLYLDLGLTLLKLGEEARVPLADFGLEGGGRKGLRQAVHRVRDDGYEVTVVPPTEVGGLMDVLRAVSDLWLAEKHTREKGFSLGFFAPDYLRRCPIAVVRRAGATIAFANLWLGAEKDELSIDLMRHRPDAPSGVMDFLFAELMAWGKAEGYAWFNLGMAPLSGLEDRALAPLWNRVGAIVFRHGEHFYNFQGLRAYKEKFHPTWTPRYLASPGGITLPRVLVNVAALISGGLRGVFAK